MNGECIHTCAGWTVVLPCARFKAGHKLSCEAVATAGGCKHNRTEHPVSSHSMRRALGQRVHGRCRGRGAWVSRGPADATTLRVLIGWPMHTPYTATFGTALTKHPCTVHDKLPLASTYAHMHLCTHAVKTHAHTDARAWAYLHHRLLLHTCACTCLCHPASLDRLHLEQELQGLLIIRHCRHRRGCMLADNHCSLRITSWLMQLHTTHPVLPYVHVCYWQVSGVVTDAP